MIDILKENGFTVLFRAPLYVMSNAVSTELMVSRFGWAQNRNTILHGSFLKRKWFYDATMTEEWYAFKEDRDAVLFKIGCSSVNMVATILTK